jgi:hypothetical protein
MARLKQLYARIQSIELPEREISRFAWVFLGSLGVWFVWHAMDHAVVGIVDVRVLPEQESSRLLSCHAYGGDGPDGRRIEMTRLGLTHIGRLKGEGSIFCIMAMPTGEVKASCSYLGALHRRFDISISGNTATCERSWRAWIP